MIVCGCLKTFLASFGFSEFDRPRGHDHQGQFGPGSEFSEKPKNAIAKWLIHKCRTFSKSEKKILFFTEGVRAPHLGVFLSRSNDERIAIYDA